MSRLELTSANIVVLAASFNPSIASKDWLQGHVFVDPPADFLSTPVMSVYKTGRVELFVDQARLQVTCTELTRATMDYAGDMVARYITKLPHTPYKAIGFNYAWRVSEPGASLASPSSGFPNLDQEFEEYCVAPSILARRQDAQIRISVQPVLGVDGPSVVTVNWHYDCADAERIAQRAHEFQPRCEDAEEIVASVLLERANVHGC